MYRNKLGGRGFWGSLMDFYFFYNDFKGFFLNWWVFLCFGFVLFVVFFCRFGI